MQLVNDYSQFNHEVCRAKFVKEENGVQFFQSTHKVGNSKKVFSSEVGGRKNELLRIGDKGDLKIISMKTNASFLFIPDRQKARRFGI